VKCQLSACLLYLQDSLSLVLGLAGLQEDFLLRKYSVLIVDEAHERTLNTDLLLGGCVVHLS